MKIVYFFTFDYTLKTWLESGSLDRELEYFDYLNKKYDVLIGASMPNALVEVGFLSNPYEEKKLKQDGHKQKIAEAIFQAIKNFKYSKEKLLITEQ